MSCVRWYECCIFYLHKLKLAFRTFFFSLMHSIEYMYQYKNVLNGCLSPSFLSDPVQWFLRFGPKMLIFIVYCVFCMTCIICVYMYIYSLQEWIFDLLMDLVELVKKKTFGCVLNSNGYRYLVALSHLFFCAVLARMASIPQVFCFRFRAIIFPSG